MYFLAAVGISADRSHLTVPSFIAGESFEREGSEIPTAAIHTETRYTFKVLLSTTFLYNSQPCDVSISLSHLKACAICGYCGVY